MPRNRDADIIQESDDLLANIKSEIAEELARMSREKLFKQGYDGWIEGYSSGATNTTLQFRTSVSFTGSMTGNILYSTI